MEGNTFDLAMRVLFAGQQMADATFNPVDCRRIFVEVTEALGRLACSVAIDFENCETWLRSVCELSIASFVRNRLG